MHANGVTHAKKICAQYNLSTKTIMLQEKETTTTIVFLISNTVVPNPYSHHKSFDPQSFAPLSYVPAPFNRTVSV